VRASGASAASEPLAPADRGDVDEEGVGPQLDFDGETPGSAVERTDAHAEDLRAGVEQDEIGDVAAEEEGGQEPLKGRMAGLDLDRLEAITVGASGSGTAFGTWCSTTGRTPAFTSLAIVCKLTAATTRRLRQRFVAVT